MPGPSGAPPGALPAVEGDGRWHERIDAARDNSVIARIDRAMDAERGAVTPQGYVPGLPRSIKGSHDARSGRAPS